MFSSLLLRNSARGADKNLCFTNAALQILRNVPSFKENCIAHLEFSPAHKHITDILNYEGTEKTVSAHPLRFFIGQQCNNTEFYDGTQNDSIEFCQFLLQNLHSSISSLFRFKTVNQKKFWKNGKEFFCEYCGKAPNAVNDEHLVLKLSLPNTSIPIRLQQLVDKYFNAEYVDIHEGLRCSHCCNHDNVTEHQRKCKPKPFQSTEQITKHSEYLIVQLKRFDDYLNKIPTNVVNSQSIVIQKVEYELVSILNHEGNFQSGHYTALLKSDKWYHCNDINCSIISNDAVESNKNFAYIFKKKRPTVTETTRPEFIPTNEFQFIPDGARLPKGCYVKMDFSTGKKQAKLDDDHPDNYCKSSSEPPSTYQPNSSSCPPSTSGFTPSCLIPPSHPTKESHPTLTSHQTPSHSTPTPQSSPISVSNCMENHSLDESECVGKILFDVKLEENLPVQVEILDLASDLLQKDNHQKSQFGCVKPSTILQYENSSQMFPIYMKVPRDAEGINIHLLRNKDILHYVVSQKLFINSKLSFRIYDSLPAGKKVWSQRLKNLPLQLKMIYGDLPNNLNDIEIVCAQNQGYHCKTRNNSGLFALANFVMITNKKDPSMYKLSRNMRGQLKSMLSSTYFVLKPFNAIEQSPTVPPKILEHPSDVTNSQK